MVRAGGSAFRTIGDQGMTDPGGGVGGSRRRQPAWQLLVGRGLGPHWALSTQAFPPLGSHSRIVTRMNGSYWTALNGCWEVGTQWCRSLQLGWTEALCRWSPGCRRHSRGMRPAGGIMPFPQRVKNELTDEGGNTNVRPISVEAEEFSLGTGERIGFRWWWGLPSVPNRTWKYSYAM